MRRAPRGRTFRRTLEAPFPLRVPFFKISWEPLYQTYHLNGDVFPLFVCPACACWQMIGPRRELTHDRACDREEPMTHAPEVTYSPWENQR